MNKNKDLLRVVSQAFYGNRTATEVKLEELDRFILGYIDSSIPMTEKVDRTIINIPNTEFVIVYNKYQEGNKKDSKRKPLAVIPEKNIEIYSRCIVCRVGESGELKSLEDGDYVKFKKYLAK